MPNTIHPKFKGVLWLLSAAVLAAIVVVSLGLLVRKIPRSFENWMGERMFTVPHSMVCTNPESEKALDELVQRIYPQEDDEKESPLKVQVLRHGPVNAFATLGTNIYVYETLIDKSQSPDELAGVLAHEMGHVQERHVLQSVAFRILLVPFFSFLNGSNIPLNARVIGALTQLQFSRDQEHEADVDGYRRLQRADVDPSGLSNFFGRLKDSGYSIEILRDHPDSESRAKIASFYPVPNPRPILTGDQWRALREICDD